MVYFIELRKVTFENIFDKEESDDSSVQSDREKHLVSNLDLEET